MSANLIKLKALLQTYTAFDLFDIPDSEIDQLKNTVDEIIQLLYWDLEDNMLEDEEGCYIAKLQASLTYLADGASNFDRHRPRTTELNAFISLLVNRIYGVIDHLRNYYPDKFNYDAFLPAHFDEYLEWQVKQKLDEVVGLLTGHNVDTDLTNLLTQFFQASHKTHRFRINTWRQWLFRQQIMDVIIRNLEHYHGGDATREVLKILIAFEFNSIQVYGYFIKYIEKITLSPLPLPEQQQELLYLLKLFRQVRTEVNLLFETSSPSLKASVLESLEAELSYIEQKEKVILKSFRDESDGQSHFYFKVAVTLAELMFFFRVAMEICMVTTKFNSHLYEFISRHIQTERAENLSKQSMRNHFSNKPFPEKVVLTVRSWMEKMIQHIDLYYK